MCVCVCACVCVVHLMYVYVCVCAHISLPPHAHLHNGQAPVLGAEEVGVRVCSCFLGYHWKVTCSESTQIFIGNGYG